MLGWAVQVGLALQYCHNHGILHRDVKPDNCFFRTNGGDLILGDFGVSCTLDTKSFAKTCVGSPMYLSPEIIDQQQYSYSTDVWSYGVLIYEVAMLEPPFKGTNICQLAFKIVTSQPAPLDTSLFSSCLRDLIAQMLEKDASRRISLESALLGEPLTEAASAAMASHGLQWPPRHSEPTSGSGSGLVGRLRGQISGSDSSSHSPAAPLDPANFVASQGDTSEYEDDFENISCDGEQEEGTVAAGLHEEGP